ncbi:hypothetical protein [Streptomyces cinereoruber]|uniref:hypothetical protein n=1 Tax=Streptomyces cinereoruber TaxID=67260 RepID=UPI003BF53C52
MVFEVVFAAALGVAFFCWGVRILLRPHLLPEQFRYLVRAARAWGAGTVLLGIALLADAVRASGGPEWTERVRGVLLLAAAALTVVALVAAVVDRRRARRGARRAE